MFNLVSWESRKPVIVGTDVVLTCTATGSKCDGTYKWVGGPFNDVLALDTSVLNHTKYAVNREDGYSLIIKNLSPKDINSSYVCHCGFYKFESILKQDASFEKDRKYIILIMLMVSYSFLGKKTQ